MTKRTQRILAIGLAVLASLILAGVSYLVFIFPMTLEMYADFGAELPLAHRVLAVLSDLSRTFGLLMFPALVGSIIGCGVWAIVAAK